MGTRADFYIGTGPTSTWIGAIQYDGHPDWKMRAMQRARSAADFRKQVAKIIRRPEVHGIAPSRGWPWPWPDSRTTDYAYAFRDGRVYVSESGRRWATFTEYRRGEGELKLADDEVRVFAPNERYGWSPILASSP